MTDEKKTSMLRLRWKIGTPNALPADGHGELFTPDHRKNLEAWCDINNEYYGAGTHWIEEVEE